MSSTEKQQRTNRAEKVAQMRAAEARAERRRRLGMAAAVVLSVALVTGVLVYLGLRSSGPGNAAASTTASTAVSKKVTSVPAATLDRIGAGTATASVHAISAPRLTSDGKPRVLYVGAEYCPYCAAQRWPVTVALSRFGTFSGLGETRSASQDVFPGTPSLSYHGATYTSDYLSFTGVEETSNKPAVSGGYKPLDTLSSADQKIVDTYNKPPYVKGQGGAIPFVDLGGTYVGSGASYSPGLLAGKSQAQVAAALADPGDPIAKAVGGAANSYTAALCDLTGGKPAAVCTSKGVVAAAGTLRGR
jgi:hypothetical protein